MACRWIENEAACGTWESANAAAIAIVAIIVIAMLKLVLELTPRDQWGHKMCRP